MYRSMGAICLPVVLAFLTGGCAANHPFVRGADLDVPALSGALEAVAPDEEALYALRYFPLAHLDLQLFAEPQEEMEGYPDGSVFASLRSWLPLFGVLEGEVEFFDPDHERYERSEFRSVLWGLWQDRHATVQTAQGERHERQGSLLWILHWGPHVEYEVPREAAIALVD